MLTISLPWPSIELSPNARVHPIVHHRAKKRARDAATVLTRALMIPMGIKPGTWVGPITVQYTFHPAMVRARDDDNFAARMKAARDGIALALGVDDVTFAQLPVIFGEVRKRAEVLVTLTPSSVVLPVRGVVS